MYACLSRFTHHVSPFTHLAMSNLDQYRKPRGAASPRGTTDIILLTLLSERHMYGYEIIQELERRSAGYFTFKEGLLYPALHALEKEGLVQSFWQDTPQGRRRRYYRLTDRGQAVLEPAVSERTTFATNLLALLHHTPAGEQP